jgi:DHA2 family multidrug resistance protein
VELDRADVQTARAQVQQAQTRLEQAQLQLSYTTITAPRDGRVTRRTVEQGAYVQTGQALLALVPDDLWVVANFKETQLERMRTGQPVLIRVDACPHRQFKGKVDSFQAGSGALFSLLPPENAVGNYVKVVQRVPVKIIFDDPVDLSQFNLAPGHVGRTQGEGPMSEPWRPRVNPWWIAAAVMLATFMEVLDTSIASVALPYIGGNLGATLSEATWVLTSYLVSNAIVLPASGWLSRYFGRKRLLISCIIIFSFSSFLCGAATSLPMLIIARVLQGAGGGALQPLAQSIMLESFPPAKRGTAMAVYGIGVVCAPILGPTLGGWLTDTWSWRWAFYINFPVSILAVLMISLFVDDPPWIRDGKPDELTPWASASWPWAWGRSKSCWTGGRRRIGSIRALDALAGRDFRRRAVVFHLLGTARQGPDCQPAHSQEPQFCRGVRLVFSVWRGHLRIGHAAAALSPNAAGLHRAGGRIDGHAARPGRLFRVVYRGGVDRKGGRAKAGGFRICRFFHLERFMFSRLSLQMARGSLLAQSHQRFWRRLHFCAVDHRRLATLRNDQIGNAAGIQNLVRNIGGSVGIAFVATMLERFAQAHQVFMTARVSALNPIYLQKLGRVQGVLQSHFSPVDARPRAQAADLQHVHQQTSYWAFIELFYAFMWLGLVCALGCVAAQKRQAVSGPGLAAHLRIGRRARAAFSFSNLQSAIRNPQFPRLFPAEIDAHGAQHQVAHLDAGARERFHFRGDAPLGGIVLQGGENVGVGGGVFAECSAEPGNKVLQITEIHAAPDRVGGLAEVEHEQPLPDYRITTGLAGRTMSRYR